MKKMFKGFKNMSKKFADMSNVIINSNNNNSNVSIVQNGGNIKMNINGKRYETQGNNVTMINGKVVIDDKEFKPNDISKEQVKKGVTFDKIEIYFEGTVKSVDASQLTIHGDITAHSIDSSSLSCDNITCESIDSSSINCDDIKCGGDIDATSINCDKITR